MARNVIKGEFNALFEEYEKKWLRAKSQLTERETAFIDEAVRRNFPIQSTEVLFNETFKRAKPVSRSFIRARLVERGYRSVPQVRAQGEA